MRKFLVLMVIALMMIGIMPVAAQDGDDPGTIVDIAVADGRFTTLVTAVTEAGLADTLSGDGPFTVFAPTDDAFAALPDGTVDALLADIPALTDILLYHVVEGEVLAETVITLDSATTLQGSDVSITVTDGRVFLNDTVEVIITDIIASNGVIHVVDSVLLPPAEEPEMAHVRVAHFSPDTPAVDVYVNGELSDVQGLEFPTVTDWISLEPGTYNIAVSPAGTSLDDAAIGPVDLEFAANSWTTITARGSLENGTLAPSLIEEPINDITEGNAVVTVFHAIEDAPAVNVQLADGTVLVNSLAYPGELGGSNDGIFRLEVPAGTYDLQVTPAADASTVLFDLAGTELSADTAYLVAAVGTLAGTPDIVLSVTDPNAMMMEDMGDDMDSEMAEDMGTIVDIAVADGRFTTLVTAVTEADLVETLSGEGPFTVFAPTDDAFAALPEGTIEALLEDIPALTDILLYHVVDGAVLAETVVTLEAATTLQGSDVTITVTDGRVFLNDTVEVIITDIEASNGVIHVIDAVLLPPSQ